MQAHVPATRARTAGQTARPWKEALPRHHRSIGVDNAEGNARSRGCAGRQVLSDPRFKERARQRPPSVRLAPSPPPPFWAKVCHIECFAGASLYEILAAGEWRSPAFLTYLDMHRRVLLRVPYVRDKFLSCHELTGWRPTWSWKLTWKTQNPILNMIDGQVCPVYG